MPKHPAPPQRLQPEFWQYLLAQLPTNHGGRTGSLGHDVLTLYLRGRYPGEGLQLVLLKDELVIAGPDGTRRAPVPPWARRRLELSELLGIRPPRGHPHPGTSGLGLTAEHAIVALMQVTREGLE